ncbi:MAG: flippase-like domain-containing protein [Anaerolineales bacterium]|nr:flippase-like domain-containing protein [Anaerolineales bacterium]
MSQVLKTARRWLPGTIISLGVIAAILYFVEFKSMWEAIVQADYLLLLAALVVGFSWIMMRGVVWRTLLRNRASYKDTFLTLCEGYLMNNFLPFRLGEFGRAFLLSRKTEMAFMEIIPTVVIERAFDLFFTAVILLSAVPFVVDSGDSSRIALVIGAVVLVGLAALFFLARNRERAVGIFSKLIERWPGLQQIGDRFLDSFFGGLAVLTDAGLFFRFILLMTANWAIAILQFYLIIAAFFPQARLTWAMFGLGAAAFGGAVPSLPGAVGTFEGAFGGALTLLAGGGEAAASTALTTALVAHLYNYLTSGIPGFYAMMTEGETLAGLYRQITSFRARQEHTADKNGGTRDS